MSVMFKEFQQVFVVNKARDFGPKLTFEWAPRTPDSPDFNPDGAPIIYVEEPTDDARHTALGRYMDAWSRLESSVGTMLSEATGVHLAKIHVLMNALGIRGDLDVLSVLGPDGLDDGQQERLSALLQRIKTNNTRRNNIVHGRWILEIRLYNWNGRLGQRMFQYRYYEPSNRDEREAVHMPENKKVREKYLFSVTRIRALTEELRRLTDDVASFNGDRAGVPKGHRVYAVEGPTRRQS